MRGGSERVVRMTKPLPLRDFSFGVVMQMNFRAIKKITKVIHHSSNRVPFSDSFKRAVAEKYGCKKGQSLPVKCHYCDAVGLIRWVAKSSDHVGYVTFPLLHLDHYIPASKGGETSVENIVLACPDCNLDKSDSLAEDWKQ